MLDFFGCYISILQKKVQVFFWNVFRSSAALVTHDWQSVIDTAEG